MGRDPHKYIPWDRFRRGRGKGEGRHTLKSCSAIIPHGLRAGDPKNGLKWVKIGFWTENTKKSGSRRF